MSDPISPPSSRHRSAAAQEITEHPFGRPPEDLPRLTDAPSTRQEDTRGIRIRTIDLANKRDRSRFLDMVAPLYRGDPHFIDPLRMERMKFLDPGENPALKAMTVRTILADQGDRVVGRMTAHIDHAYNRYHGVQVGWFGFFESINDRRAAHAMLKDGTDWLKLQGVTEIIGPMNFSTNHQCGLLVENFERPPVIEMTYNPPYYESLLTSFGLKKAKDLLAWWIDVTAGRDDPKIGRIAKIADKIKQREGVTIRSVSKRNFEQEVARLFTLYNEAWQKNWGFVPVSKEEFYAISRDLKQIVIEDLILLIEMHNQPVAFSVTLPDINEVMPRNGRLLPFGWVKLLFGMKSIKHARLMALGVSPAFRKRGLESMLFVETALRARKLGMRGGEISWTLEDNELINRAIQSMGGRLDRRYRLFGATAA